MTAWRPVLDTRVPGVASATSGHAPDPLLRVRGLCKDFPIYSRGFLKRQIGAVKACDDVSFDLMPGETLGLVGESGCGKTTTGRTILRALRPTRGEVLFRIAAGRRTGREAGRGSRPGGSCTAGPEARQEADSRTGESSACRAIDLASLPERELKPLRPHLQMIFQDPFSSLNPRMTVRDIVGEPLVIHGMARGSTLEDRVSDMLRKVGLKPEHRTRYPHAFSGGQRQRIGIARALIMNPSLVVCDEAVSALDVSVQAQVINLLSDLQQEMHLTYLFIAHDLSVVKHSCDRVAVMYAGRIVELAPTGDLFNRPAHPYTRMLLSAVPDPDPDRPMRFEAGGEVADPGNLPPGCAFHPRCPLARDGLCDCGGPPALERLGPDRSAACHLVKQAVPRGEGGGGRA